MWALLWAAHDAKWGKATLRLFVKTKMGPKYMTDPRVLRILELWPEKYEDMKEWPAELLPETHAPV